MALWADSVEATKIMAFGPQVVALPAVDRFELQAINRSRT